MKYVELEFADSEYEEIIVAMRNDPNSVVKENHIDDCVAFFLEDLIIEQICQPRS